MSLNQVSEEYSVERHLKYKLNAMVEEIAITCLELIRAQKSSSETDSSVNY